RSSDLARQGEPPRRAVQRRCAGRGTCRVDRRAGCAQPRSPGQAAPGTVERNGFQQGSRSSRRSASQRKEETDMKKLIAIASAAALGLGLAACDSPAEDAAEEQAEAIEDQADALEDAGAITDAEADVMEEQADRVEDAAE